MVSERFSTMTESNLIDDYWCDRCADDLTWNWNTWECETCAETVLNCAKCNRFGQCLECEGDLIPSYDGYTCE